MSEPRRLLDGGLPADIADLLQSAERDVPPAEEKEKRRIFAAAASSSMWAAPVARSRSLRTVAWIGLAVAVLAIGEVGVYYGSSPEAPDSTPRTAGSVATAASPFGGTERFTVAPRTDVGASGAAARTDVGASGAAASLPVGVSNAAARTDVGASTAAESTRVGASAVAAPSTPVEQLPPAMAALRTPHAPAAPSERARIREGNVEQELELIDAARGALAANQPAVAHSHLQRYRASFSTPHFVDEADALEVQALAALGRNDEARTKAERFLEVHSGSPYTQRVRSAAGLRTSAAGAR